MTCCFPWDTRHCLMWQNYEMLRALPNPPFTGSNEWYSPWLTLKCVTVFFFLAWILYIEWAYSVYVLYTVYAYAFLQHNFVIWSDNLFPTTTLKYIHQNCKYNYSPIDFILILTCTLAHRVLALWVCDELLLVFTMLLAALWKRTNVHCTLHVLFVNFE